MSLLSVSMSIGEQDTTDLLSSLVELTIDEELRMAATLRMRIALTRGPDGTWHGLDDERIAVWKKIQVSVAVGDEETELFRGYITDLKVHFERDLDSSWGELFAMDESCLMAIEEKVRDWPDKADSDIASEIFSSYGLSLQVEATKIVHTQTLGTILQRESDIAFLQRLAARNGYECLVKRGEGWFRAIDLSRTPRPTLSVHFGEETNVLSFDATMRAIGPATVEAAFLDVVAKEIKRTLFTTSSLTALGLTPAASATAPPTGIASLTLRNPLALSLEELECRCQAVGEESTWFIRAQFELDTGDYGTVLNRGDCVPVRGVGKALSGLYYVAAVTYRLSGDRLVQRATGIRNASAPGSESDFVQGGAV